MQQIAAANSGPHPKPAIVAAVQQAAARTGTDFSYLVDVARIESGFVPTAQAATSTARGLFQFTQQTWLTTLDRHGAAHGYGWAADAIGRQPSGRLVVADPAMRAAIFALRDDPVAAAAMAGEFTNENRALLSERLQRAPEQVDLYLAHFLGAQGAAQFLKAWEDDPSQSGAALLPSAAATNRSIFFDQDGQPRSLDSIRERFRSKLAAEGHAAPFAAPPMPEAAPAGPRKASSFTVLDARSDQPSPLPLMEMTAMPRRLSLAFAAESYRRLAALDGRGGQA